MIKSDFKEDIVNESRGIILDRDDNWKIISYPYNKFFNYGSSHAPNLNWEESFIYDKLDGSLMVLYWYDNQWNVSTSGMPDGNGPVQNETKGENQQNQNQQNSLTFADLFWNVWKELNYNFPKNQTNCYIFELMTKLNEVVVPQTKNRLVLHGVRSLIDYQEENPYYYNKYGWEIVSSKRFDEFKYIESVVEEGKNKNPLESEGYVVCDNNFNRIKIKSTSYVLLAHLGINNNDSDSISKTKNLVKIIQMGEDDEIILSFPKIKEEYTKIKTKYNDVILEISQTVEETKNCKTNKELAMKIKGKWFSQCVFSMRSGKIKSVDEWLSNIDTKKIIERFEKKS